MGSNPSKNEVVKIRIPSSKGTREESDNSSTSKPNKTTSQLEVDRLKGELNILKAELKTQKEQNANSEDTSYSLQNQLDEREREILLLREELDSLQRKTSMSTKSDKENENSNLNTSQKKCDRTIYAKDQYIQTLEEELKMMKELVAKQEERYQRKLKKLRSVLSKSKQDSSLKLFELKDEKSKLVEENTKLQERIERMSLDSEDFGRQGSASSQSSVLSRDKNITEDVTNKDVIDNHDDPRMKLILELSEQVANLDSENLALKQELKHCRKVAERVEKLRIQKKQGQTSKRTEIVCVEGNSSWKGLESNQACLEIT